MRFFVSRHAVLRCHALPFDDPDLTLRAQRFLTSVYGDKGFTSLTGDQEDAFLKGVEDAYIPIAAQHLRPVGLRTKDNALLIVAPEWLVNRLDTCQPLWRDAAMAGVPNAKRIEWILTSSDCRT